MASKHRRHRHQQHHTFNTSNTPSTISRCPRAQHHQLVPDRVVDFVGVCGPRRPCGWQKAHDWALSDNQSPRLARACSRLAHLGDRFHSILTTSAAPAERAGDRTPGPRDDTPIINSPQSFFCHQNTCDVARTLQTRGPAPIAALSTPIDT